MLVTGLKILVTNIAYNCDRNLKMKKEKQVKWKINENIGRT